MKSIISLTQVMNFFESNDIIEIENFNGYILTVKGGINIGYVSTAEEVHITKPDQDPIKISSEEFIKALKSKQKIIELLNSK